MPMSSKIGFDFGTSHCAIGVKKSKTSTQVNLIPLTPQHALVPSTLYTFDRSLIYDFVANHLSDSNNREGYLKKFANFLGRAKTIASEWDLPKQHRVLFGHDAFNEYIKDPSEGYYIRSPKSFLGSSGLSGPQLSFIEQIVTTMMMAFKASTESHLQAEVTDVVLGRPINFQGIRGEQSNAQALEVLRAAANTAGFKNIEFLYEPLAAGFDFETRLTTDKRVMVVDIGGGTTDCSMIQMGPQRSQNQDRQPDILGHCGQRIGGNDFDIHLSFSKLMPLFGSESRLKSSKPMPTQPFWQAVETNNAGSQLEFYSEHYLHVIENLRLSCLDTKEIDRLIHLRKTKTNFQLVAAAETAKISLSENSLCDIDLPFIENDLSVTVTQHELPEVFNTCLNTIRHVINETIQTAGCQPECVYVTGGMGQSPFMQSVIAEHLRGVEVLNGDYFTSVTAGLTHWANRIF